MGVMAKDDCPVDCTKKMGCGACLGDPDAPCAFKTSGSCVAADSLPMSAKMSEYKFTIKDCKSNGIGALNALLGSGGFAKTAGKYCSKRIRGASYDSKEDAEKACEAMGGLKKSKRCKGFYQSGCKGQYKLCKGSLSKSSKGSCAYMK